MCEFTLPNWRSAWNLGNQLRKELNNVINVGSELPSDTPIREQLVKKKQDLETYMDVPLI